ncbi:hypothetical protein [uncultured Aeromicrobium sp.]|uniref:hypothetical protein n=1 Tax=uncultured Aeromicrobium sp. TaxID=337820 RepID=UPI0025DB08AC|nr:hypothetical protein [uncultured Aeromicrobium sp.]
MNRLSRMWNAVREPRVQRVVFTVVYAVLTAAGIAVLRQPPTSIEGEIGMVLAYSWGALLAVSVCGVLGTLPGWWWLEKIGASGAVSGLAIYGVIVWVLHFSEPLGNRLPQALVITASVLLLGLRSWEIRGLDYEPRR